METFAQRARLLDDEPIKYCQARYGRKLPEPWRDRYSTSGRPLSLSLDL